MTTTTENGTGGCAGPASTADEIGRLAGPNRYDERVAALAAAYHRTVDHIMTDRYGQGWATRGDLDDDAYLHEIVFTQWLDDLLDHLDSTVRRLGGTSA